MCFERLCSQILNSGSIHKRLDMDSEVSHVDKSFKSRWVLLVLLLTSFLATSGISFFGTLLPDIASSFGVSIGTASTIGLVVNFVGLTVGLLMGALTIRFKHKSLFLLGIAMLMVAELGMFFSQSFSIMLLTSLFSGMGRAMVSIMIVSLIGGLFPLEKRGWAIGLVVSASFIAFVLVPSLSASIAHVAGWRSFLIWFSFPIALASITLGLLVIPSKSNREQSSAKSRYLEAFKSVLLNKSALACILSATLLTLAGTVAAYAVSFYRINFSVPQVTAGIFASAVAIGGIFGAVGGGRLINRYGRKPLVVVAGFVSGMAVLSFTFMANVWVSLAFWAVSATTAAVAEVGLRSLTLEQIPRFRGSMMSMHTTFDYVGTVLGMTIGTFVLNLYANNFQLLMTIFGASGMASAPLLQLLARDPGKNQPLVKA